MWFRRVAFVFIVSLAANCVEPIIQYVDPPITLPEGGGYQPEGNPTVELGFYNEQLYSPLETGGMCPIVNGLQGGTWTMPAVRVVGLSPVAVLTCSLVTKSGEVLGEVISEVDFVLATDGWLELQSFPVPVNHAAPNEGMAIDDLYGQEATLWCEVVDDAERSAENTARVVLQEG